MTPVNYVVATLKPWNVELFEQRHSALPGEWHLVQSREELSLERIQAIKPRYIFFPHWSWVVPQSIASLYECVGFHMTDLPFGRGGSPLQNLIVRGVKETKVTALRMEQSVDAGPVYMKRPLKLDGSAEQIFTRYGILVWDMISEFIVSEPVAQQQVGESEKFKRRLPDQSVLPIVGSLKDVYDHIRMLDARTYPHAFLEYGEWRIEFLEARLGTDHTSARVVIKKRDLS